MKRHLIDQVIGNEMPIRDKIKYLNEVLDRRTGNTTRFIDESIQRLFQVGYILLRQEEQGEEDSRRIFKLLVLRLISEHGIDQFKIDYKRRMIDWVEHHKFQMEQDEINDLIAELVEKEKQR
jgi:hypothetical protein